VLEVLPALVTGQAAELRDGLEVTLAPGSVMPPVLEAGNGDKALRRAAAYGDGWLSIGLPPEDVAAGLARWADSRLSAAGRCRARALSARRSTTIRGRPRRNCPPMPPPAPSGVILAPSGTDWQRDYEFAGQVQAAL